MQHVEYGTHNLQTIILLHGGGLSWWNYRDVAQLLSDRFHVVLPILDGHAGSDAPFTSIEDNAARIIAHIDEHFGGKVLAVGGLSLGGQIRWSWSILRSLKFLVRAFTIWYVGATFSKPLRGIAF